MQVNSSFLINFGLVSNYTFFALYKLEKDKELNDQDIASMKEFLNILLSIKNSIDNPFDNWNEQKNFLPLLNVINESKIKDQVFNKKLNELSNLIDKQTKPNGLLNFVKSISEKIDEILDRDNFQDKDNWRVTVSPVSQ